MWKEGQQMSEQEHQGMKHIITSKKITSKGIPHIEKDDLDV